MRIFAPNIQMAVLPKVRSALCAASQLPGEGPTDVEDDDDTLLLRGLGLPCVVKAADAEVVDCDVGSGGWGVEVLSNASILNDAGIPGNQHHPKRLVLHSTVTFLKNTRKFGVK